MTGVHHYTQLLLEMGFLNFLSRLAWNHHPLDFHLLSS
jgi:hypothetical protein